jgi:hypothetical protein
MPKFDFRFVGDVLSRQRIHTEICTDVPQVHIDFTFKPVVSEDNECEFKIPPLTSAPPKEKENMSLDILMKHTINILLYGKTHTIDPDPTFIWPTTTRPYFRKDNTISGTWTKIIIRKTKEHSNEVAVTVYYYGIKSEKYKRAEVSSEGQSDLKLAYNRHECTFQEAVIPYVRDKIISFINKDVKVISAGLVSGRT